MGSCCNVADKAIDSDILVPGNQEVGDAKYSHADGSGNTMELFVYQQLEIFNARNNNPVVLVSIWPKIQIYFLERALTTL